MAQQRGMAKNITDARSDRGPIHSVQWKEIPEVPKKHWEFEEDGEEMEEEEMTKEPSYEIYEAPPPEERDIGQIIKDSYGFYRNYNRGDYNDDILPEEVIYRYTLCNANGMLVQVITLGAAITAIRMPDSKNVITDVTLGLNSLDDYISDKNNLWFGSVLGRYNSFIFNSTIEIGKKEYMLSTNIDGVHHDKGGYFGFDKAVWQSYVSYDRVIMTHVSPHLEEGYPGDLMVQMSFHLTKDNCLIVNTTASTSLPTLLSIGHNIFFNLAGHESGPEGLKEHSILLNADKFVEVDSLNMPTGELVNVGATYFDLRVPRPLWKAIARVPGGGYDHVFCLTKGYPRDSVCFACRLVHPQTGRYLEVMTDMPAIHINTGTALPNPEQLPPLEAQTGFNEEMYPDFCREEKMKEKMIKELQNKMAAKQTWPRQETLPEYSDTIIALPSDQSMEKKVIFHGKKKEAIIIEKKEEKPKDEEKSENPAEYEEEDKNTEADSKSSIQERADKTNLPGDEIKALKFLKDVAESDEEEQMTSKWRPPQPIVGRRGAEYKLNGGISLMTQEYPDCMKHENFPKAVLKPGQKYSRTTIYKFGIIPARTDQDATVYL